MNKLSQHKRIMILNMLVEGMSMYSITRTLPVSLPAVAKLLVDAGKACAEYHDKTVVNVRASRVQCDEIWSFCYAKSKNVASAKNASEDAGDVWTWTALDIDSKMILSWEVGDRSGETALEFMDNFKSRLANQVQMTTDGHKTYLEAVESTFGGDVDYPMLVKLYGGDDSKSPAKRYSPGKCVGIEKSRIEGSSDPNHINTSNVEQHNLTMRMGMRRFNRLTNAFSKKIENHVHMLSLYFVHYNFIRIHKSLKSTPAMAAGVTDTLLDMERLVDMIDENTPKPNRRKTRKKRNFQTETLPNDEVECRYQGRNFTPAEMALMRSLIAASPQNSRAGLAREFCHAINWVGTDGRIKKMTAVVAMLAMHRDGIITLPPPKRASPRPGKPKLLPETDAPQDPMPQALDAVRPIRFVQITGAGYKASSVWNGFIDRWHYLGYKRLIGAQMRYIVEDLEGRPLAALGFQSAAWKTAARDTFIGWSPETRERNLPYVIDNSRFLILPWVRIPNLASHILSQTRRQVPQDWYDRYKVTPVLIETFVEIPRFTGGAYKASGWVHVGTTSGRGKYDTKYEYAKPKKDIWLCPLRKNWKRKLTQ